MSVSARTRLCLSVSVHVSHILFSLTLLIVYSYQLFTRVLLSVRCTSTITSLGVLTWMAEEVAGGDGQEKRLTLTGKN